MQALRADLADAQRTKGVKTNCLRIKKEAGRGV